jgi:hypothetical protein
MALVRRCARSRAARIGVTGAVVLLSVVGAMRSVGRSPFVSGMRARLASTAHPSQTLRLYYTAPVLVRAGEQVVVPTDAVCATVEGVSCSADVELSAQVGDEPWRSAHASGLTGHVFDLTRSASRAGSRGMVSFAVRATGGAGSTAALGAPVPGASLHFYVTDRMPVAAMPPIRSGDVRGGEPMLSLPWGSGPLRAGIEPGDESDTVGPMSFDVDSTGRIYLLDSIQQRLAVFDGGSLIREVELPGLLYDVAALDDGSAFVLTKTGETLEVRRVSPSGETASPTSLGAGVPGQVRPGEHGAVVDLLPLDAWAEVPEPGRPLDPLQATTTGRPLGGGRELLRVARPDGVRVGIATGGEATDAVEIRSGSNLGDVPLAEPDGAGGYWVVVHVWQEEPRRADRYQVVHVRGGHVVASFAVTALQYASAPSANRFRLVGGALYQMTSSSQGLEIVRYPLGGAS